MNKRFLLSVIVKNAEANVGERVSGSLIAVLLHTQAEVELLSLMAILCLTIWETNKLFSQHFHHFISSPAINECSNFSTSLPTLVIFLLFVFFNKSHPNGYEVVSHYGLDLLFPNDSSYWAFFLCWLSSVCLLWRNLYFSPLCTRHCLAFSQMVLHPLW